MYREDFCPKCGGYLFEKPVGTTEHTMSVKDGGAIGNAYSLGQTIALVTLRLTCTQCGYETEISKRIY